MTYAPLADAVRQARHFVQAQLVEARLEGLADDAGLLASELAANAVLHARTDFEVLVHALDEGARVEVRDRSRVLPVFTAPSATAMSGRGLILVQSVAARWGSRLLACGKGVWFEIAQAAAPAGEEVSVEELLALWADQDDGDPNHGDPDDGGPAAGPAGASHVGAVATTAVAGREVVVAEVAARELLAAKEHMDDLLRELQLMLLDATDEAPVGQRAGFGADGPGGAAGQQAALVQVAGDLDTAARAFDVVRRQVREQVTRAVARGQDRVRLRLHIPPDAGSAAVAYRQAVAAAEALSRTGSLLTGSGDLDRHAAVRRAYLDAVIEASSRH